MRNSLLAIDDDEKCIESIERIIRKDRNLSFLGSCAETRECFDIIRRSEPDLVLLEYFMPELDGVEVIERVMADRSLLKKPKFIIVSGVNSSRLISEALQAGASYYILKPFDERMLLKKIHQVLEGDEPGYAKNSTLPLSIQDTLAVQIRKLLMELGVAPHLKGFSYLEDAVMMTVRKQTRADPSLTKVIYPAIARMNMTSSSRVERSMRHAIELAWERGNVDRMYEVVARSRNESFTDEFCRKPTTGEFIACCAGVIREKNHHFIS